MLVLPPTLSFQPKEGRKTRAVTCSRKIPLCFFPLLSGGWTPPRERISRDGQLFISQVPQLKTLFRTTSLVENVKKKKKIEPNGIYQLCKVSFRFLFYPSFPPSFPSSSIRSREEVGGRKEKRALTIEEKKFPKIPNNPSTSGECLRRDHLHRPPRPAVSDGSPLVGAAARHVRFPACRQ